MNTLDIHIDKIAGAVDEWLRPDNDVLKEAIDNTVNEGLFSFPDLKHRIKCIKKTVHKNGLKTWAEKSGLVCQSLKDKRIVCLHAGNLPLVGMQDMLSVIMTGGIYVGKLSKKDPYLLPTLLRVLRKHGLLDRSFWTTELHELRKSEADGVLFAGSDASVNPVREKLNKLKIIKPDAASLMRTAHFSVAMIEDNHPKTMKDLTEAVFRYGGAGCRSVAVVVAPYHLNSQKCSFTDYVEAYWLDNPQHKKPFDNLYYRFAYNKAVQIPQAWLNDFLIEENLSEPVEQFLLYWVKGNKNDVENIIHKYRKGLQSVYIQAGSSINEIAGIETKTLSKAQTPPVYWKPDGVDSIAWLQDNIPG